MKLQAYLVIITLVLFASCKKLQGGDITENPIEKAFEGTGEISLATEAEKAFGKHIISINSQSYILKSIHHNLDNYVQKKVNISGTLVEKSPETGGSDYIKVIEISVLPAPPAVPEVPSAPAVPAQEIAKPKERVILDTDVGGDVDDAGALGMLHALADRGEIEILAVGVVIGHELAVPFVHAVNTWYGRPDLPIGTIKEKAPYSRDEFMQPIVASYPHSLKQQTAPEVVKLYRKILAAQPDKSVTLIAIGPATNIYNLLKSQPDEHSSLNGVELMRRKVKFYGAGGNGAAGLPKGNCGFNYYTDMYSASTELKLLPVEFPTVFAGGSGLKLEVGSALTSTRPDHIIRKSYESYYKGQAKDRFSWDQLRVLYACRPSARNLWETSPFGNIFMGLDGVITYTPGEGNKAYAYVKDFTQVKNQLNELMVHDPKKN